MARTDEAIKKDIIDELYWDNRVDSSDITVQVDNGDVTLNGTVSDYTSSKNAVLDAWDAEGVTEVKNNLEVEIPTEVSVPTDSEIKSNIADMLEWNASIDASEIEVDVSAGVVTLDGVVDAYWKKLRAEDVTSRATGVLNVVNELAVVPTEDVLDKAIAEDVVSALETKFTVNADDVDVKVEDGIVTLSGTLPSWTSYRAAMDAAENTLGVTDVVDQLIIE
ncbi:MAG: BON domain-containing protein [Candidatus Thorarchaeota archaeon]